jgi:regulatory protein|tara:strand:+ start:130 stop:606 length:477 start_codon:yes stop_codon:yes gene_type:complete
VSSIETDVPVFRRAAMDFLARREHSHYELQQKLAAKFPDADHSVLLSAIERLRQENLQSDERFTEAFIRYRKSRGFGMRHIQQDLKLRGVDDRLLEKYLFEDDEDWMKIVQGLVVKKLGNVQKLEFGDSAHRRLVRFLESRGFQSTQIQYALSARLKC